MEVDDDEGELWFDPEDHLRNVGTGPDTPPPEAAEVGTATDPEEPKVELVDWLELVCEFEEWIYMKTQLMPRDKAFVKVLAGLMQRWLKMKNIEVYPKDFTDCLMKAAIKRVKPSDVEAGLAERLADPDTRSGIEVLNDAIGGEVKCFSERTVNHWVETRACRVNLASPLSLIGVEVDYTVTTPMLPWWIGMFLKGIWLGIHLFCEWFWGGPPEPDMFEVWIPAYGGFYSKNPGFHWVHQWWSVYWATWTIIDWTGWYGLYCLFRRTYCRVQYFSKDYTRAGFFKALDGSLRIFQSGNVKSQ